MPLPRLLLALAALPLSLGAQAARPLVLTPDLRIDPATADLTRVGSMLVSPSGEMIISQPDDQTIRVFSATGAASRFGRGGEGPGEFRENWNIGWLGDSLWVLDPELRRVSIFSPSHKFVRSFPEPAAVVDATGNTVSELYFMGVYPDGSLRAVAAYRWKSEHPSWLSGLDSGTTVHVRMSPKGTFLKRILAVPPSRCHRYFATGGGGYAMTTSAFCGETLVAERNGSPLVAMAMVESTAAGTASYRVTVVDADGIPRFARSYPFTPRAVSRAALDSAAAARKKAFARLPPEVVSAMPNMPPTTEWPPLRRIVLGRDETVWLEQSTGDLTTHRWLVLDRKGNPVGTATLPQNVSLEVADLNNVWGLESDADGFQGVVRYRVRQ